MKQILVLALSFFLTAFAFAKISNQSISCKEVDKHGKVLKDGRAFRMEIEGDLSKLEGVDFKKMSDDEVRAYKVPVSDGNMVVTGLWKKSSRLGKGKFWESDMLGKVFWYQHSNKPTMTVAFEDKEQTAITYRFYMNTDQLGKSFKNGKGHLWIDPDAPEGGGWPVELLCNSKAE
ncbi:MAG: hypothetical protein HY537_02885 [Deltaproteobacteria bacterium]|nr:hypothetical protein [Deltaproteobacteria bacterium]